MVKPLDRFYRMTGMKDGYRNECKACNLAAKAARYKANPEPARQRAQQWKRDNPDRYLANQQVFRESGRKKIADRKSHLKRKYGLTPEAYDSLFAEQGGGCAICRRSPRGPIAFHIDHDHETGRIRGLLCFRCNNALGDFDDDPAVLRAAIDYLEPATERDPLIEARLDGLKAMRAAS
jgi:hypothetical protein